MLLDGIDFWNAYKELNYTKLGKYGYEKEVEFEIKNHKEENIVTYVEFNLEGNWEIISSSDDYEKENSKKIKFKIKMDRESTKKIVVKYEVKY